VLSDIDAHGNKDLFINQREDLWQIKTKPLSPFTGIAKSCHIRNLDEDIQREIQAKGITGDKYIFSMVVPQPDRDEAILATGVESYKQNQSKQLKELVEQKNKNIEKELTDDVEKTFEKHHAQRKNMFM
jgi:hypothetical protein